MEDKLRAVLARKPMTASRLAFEINRCFPPNPLFGFFGPKWRGFVTPQQVLAALRRLERRGVVMREVDEGHGDPAHSTTWRLLEAM